MQECTAAVKAASSDYVHTPILSTKSLKAWPKHDDGGSARYVSHVKAFTDHYPTDAHFAAYSCPGIPRRLSRDAVGKLDGGVHMRLAVFDVDGAGHAAADEWWELERAKVFDLLEEHVDGLVYRTRGGYRIVFMLSRPVYLRDASDADAWTDLYVSWCRYLARRFDIVADHACKDWQRLYRLPHATRDEGGQPEDREIIGDPTIIGTWGCELTADDMAAPKKTVMPNTTPRVLTYTGRGRLVDAFDRNGWLGGEVEPGKYSARCPWESSHSTGATLDTSTIVYEADNTRGDLGWWHCSHAHCQDKSIKDVIAMFSDDELGNERKQLTGYVEDLPNTSGNDIPTYAEAGIAKPITVPLCDFLGDEDEADKPDDFVTNQLLPTAAVTFLAGEPKTYKTYTAIYWALCVATGRDLFGKFACKQSSAVIIAEEDDAKRIRRRIWHLARGLGISSAELRALPIRVSAMGRVRIDEPEHLARLEMECKGAGLVVLDALTRIHGGDENSRTDMQAVTSALTTLAVTTGAAVLTLHHFKKSSQHTDGVRPGQMMRGTSDLHALARSIIGVKKKAGQLHMEAEGNYVEDVEPFAVELSIEPRDDGKLVAAFELVGTSKDADDEVTENAVISVLSSSDAPMSKEALRAAITGEVSKTDAAVKRLAVKGTISPAEHDYEDSIGRKRKAKGWSLVDR